MCSAPCGAGRAMQMRKIVQPAENGGIQCASLTRVVPCNNRECAVDCEVGSWSNASTCTRTCGHGRSIRTREVKTKPLHGGKACPVLRESSSCNTQKCPVDCVERQWGKWTRCSRTCGTGNQLRTRDIMQPAMYGGRPCGDLIQHQECSDHPCPVDCRLAPWSAWTKCSRPCGGGQQTRSRPIQASAKNGGKACAGRSENRKCNVVPCQVQCQSRVGGYGQDFDFAKCSSSIQNILHQEQKKCKGKGQDFVLKRASDASGDCIAPPAVDGVDLSSGGVSSKLPLLRAKESVMDADVALSCPVSINSKLTPEEVRDAEPYAVCVTTTQRICSDFESSPTCLMTEQTKCSEVCVGAKFCQKTMGTIQSRKHGWRSPGGYACCFKDCKLPDFWYAEDGSPLEPASWCHQTHSSRVHLDL